MKITIQNIIRILLVILMMTSSIQWGSVVCAQSLPGSGTEEDPYLINSADDWNNKFLSDIKSRYDYNGKFVKLTKNISIGNSYYNGAGDGGYTFKGTFDGDGHTIKVGITYSYSLFDKVTGGTIKNLRVTGSYGSNQDMGGIMYYSEGETTIENCIVSASITAAEHCGGFVNNVKNTLTIKDCLFLGNIKQTKSDYICGGFVGRPEIGGSSKNYIKNSLFRPNEVSVSTSNAKTFTYLINKDSNGDPDAEANFITNCYYFTQLGGAQGINANITSDNDILAGLGDSWKRNNDFFYLKTWCKNVDIYGWAEGATAKDPTLENNYECFNDEKVYTYKKVDAGSYSSTVPSAAGHYTVKAKILDGWESTKNFWIVKAPTAIENLTYNGSDRTLLSADGNTTEAGIYYYKLGKDGSWSTTIPTAKAVGTYTVYYYVKSTNPNDHYDIGSENEPAGSVDVEIGSSTGEGFTISVEDCTYNGSAQQPKVTVKYGNEVVPSSEYTVSYSNNFYAGTGNVTVTDIEGGTYTVNGTATFTIKRKELTVPAVKVNPTTMTYTGSALKPQVTVYDSEVEIDESEYSVSYSENTNVGTAKVTVSDKEGGNYKVNGSAEFTISKAQLGCTAPKAKSLTYNGAAQELVTAGSITGTGDISDCTMLYSTDGSNYSSSLPTGTDAKSYTVYYKVTGGNNHKDISASSVSVSIGAKEVTNPTITLNPSSYKYDGTAKKPEVTVKDGDTVIASSEYSVSYSNNTNVGTATVIIKDNDGGNYTVSGSASFKIVSEDASYTAPTANAGLTYNGEAQKLVSAGSTATGTMKYSLDGKTYSTDIPTGTNAKTYTVYYKVEGDGNHADSEAATVEVTISSKALPSPAVKLSPTTMTYTGSALKPDVTVRDGDNEIDESEYTVTYKNNTNAGSGEVEISDKENGNYSITTTTATFTINKAQLGSTAPKAKSLTYNGAAQELVTAGTITGTGDISDCTMLYSTDGSNYSSSLPTGTDAKSYTVYYKVTGGNNHKDISASSVSVSIGAKEMTNPKIEVSPSSFTYDGKAKTPDVTVKDKDTDTVISSNEYTVSYSDNTNVGTATVSITDKDGGNYKVSGTATFSIQEAGSTYTAPTAKTGLTYNVSKQELLTAGSTTTGEMQYSSDGKTYSTAIPTGTDAKTYTVYYKVVGDGNHKDSSPVSLTVTISEKTLSSPTIILSESSYAYDGSAKKPTVTVKDGENVVPISEYTVSYSDNVSVGTATVTIIDEDGGNYIVNGSTNFRIVDAETEFTAPTAKTGLVYNGKAQELVTAGSAKDGTLSYSTDGTNYSTSLPTGTDAKTYTVYYKVTGDANHGDVEATSVSVTISAKTVDKPTITVSPSSYTYDGTAKEPTVTVYDEDGETKIVPSEYSVSYSNNTNVGTATVKIKDNDGGNYTVNGSASFKIASEDASYTAPTANAGLIYNGEAQKLVSAGSTATGTMKYSLDGKTYSTAIPTGTNAQTYMVYYKVEGDGNHTDSEPATVEVTINRKALSLPAIKVNPTAMTYTGSPLKPDVTVWDNDDEIDESEYTVTYKNNTNAGSGEVEISDKENGNYSITTTTATFTINKAQLGSTAPKAKSLTYNGAAQELVTAGTITGTGDISECAMMYSTDGSNYSSSLPTGTDAKTYTVYYKVTGDSNHKDILASSITVTIGAKKLFTSAISISQTSYSYDGKAKEPTVTVKDGDTDVSSSEYTVSYSDNTDVGTATVTVTDNPGGNYEVSGSVQFTITSGDATYTPPSAKQGLIYNKKDQELVNAGSATNGVMKYSLDNKTYSSTIPTGKDAKNYVVYYKVTGDPNHADMAAQNITVTISPKTVSAPTITVIPSSVIYDGSAQKPSVIVKDGRDEIDGSEYTVSYANNKEIGTATVTITDNEDGNYSVSGSATFTIVDALAFEVKPEAKSGLTYNGKSQELVTPGVAPEGTMFYSLDGMNFTIDIPTGLDAGKYIVYYKVVDEYGVAKGATSTITVIISPKKVACNVIVTGRGQFNAPLVEVIDENDQVLEPDGYKVEFRNTDEEEVIPDAYGRMEAGFYRVIVTPTGNYTGPSVSTTFRIRGELSFKFEMHSDVITICLPFTRSLPSDYEAYRFDHIDMDNMPVFEQVKTKQLQAGEPYVLKYVGSKSSTRATTRILDLSPGSPALVDLSTPLREQQNGNLSFLGTFDDLSNQKARTLGAYILHSNNSWRASASAKAGDDHKTYLEAFHAYMVYRNHSTPEEELTVLIPGVIVGIDKIILEDEAGEQSWYDLNGRRIDKPQKGVNILRTASGKTRKVVIK